MLGFTTLEPPDDKQVHNMESTGKKGYGEDTPGFKRNKGYDTVQTESTLQRSSAFKRKVSENSGGESGGIPPPALTI